jgi:hypothetical protein
VTDAAGAQTRKTAAVPELTTDRLLLRRWQAGDRSPFAELVSFTAGGNARSRAVMRRLGMRHDDADDFDHPLVRAGELRRHVLYRLAAADWEASLRAR